MTREEALRLSLEVARISKNTAHVLAHSMELALLIKDFCNEPGNSESKTEQIIDKVFDIEDLLGRSKPYIIRAELISLLLPYVRENFNTKSPVQAAVRIAREVEEICHKTTDIYDHVDEAELAEESLCAIEEGEDPPERPRKEQP